MGDLNSLRTIALAVDLAARAHEGQRRRAGRREAFVSHVLDVARRVSESPALDEETLLAAILHDLVEKTDHDLQEVRQMFGSVVASIVAELTDDPALSSSKQKRRQVEEAARFSDRAKRIKLADKASKLASIAAAPPRWWGRRKAAKEVSQARKVVARLRGVDAILEQAFDREARRADDALGR